ncbi:ABC transporter permease [Nocardioides sp. CPCC 205120]|uniref:ABC transporter permease n=1 Tax=Nocardioides sp. CPCC 205120 TaxID=3406462 RepID=UPI003B501C2A
MTTSLTPAPAPAPAPAAVPTAQRGRGPRPAGAPRWVISAGTGVLALVLWAVVAAVVDDPILPTPFEVGGAIASVVGSGAALEHFTASITKIVAGFGLALLAGVPIGFLMGRSRFLTTYFSLPLFVLGNVPGLTYAVFGLVVFGVGATGPIVVSALVATPFVAINVAEGTRSVDGKLLAMCQAFDRGPSDVARHLYVPALTSFVFAGVRYGFAMAWKVEALTEVFGASNGVGFMIRRAYQEFQVADMLAWTALFIVLMVLVERALAFGEDRLFAWRKELR